jgi:hypothetical protein
MARGVAGQSDYSQTAEQREFISIREPPLRRARPVAKERAAHTFQKAAKSRNSLVRVSAKDMRGILIRSSDPGSKEFLEISEVQAVIQMTVRQENPSHFETAPANLFQCSSQTTNSADETAVHEV